MHKSCISTSVIQHLRSQEQIHSLLFIGHEVRG